MTSKRRQAGFTLLEMMIVIVVMGLLLSLVLTHGPERSPVLTLRAATDRVAGALRLARTEAIATGRQVPFVIDAATHRFAANGRVGAVPADITLSVPPGPIVFEPDGSATSGRIGLGLRRMHALVVVHWLNGRVSVDQASSG